MIRRSSEPRTLQRNRLARVMRDRDADEVFIAHDASRWIEVDPAWTGNIDLNPGMGFAAGGTIVVVIIGQMEISGHEPRGNSARAKRRYHKHGEVTATAASEIKRADRILDTLLVPRYVLEGPHDGPCHVAEQLVSVGRAIFAEEHSAPAINLGMRRQRPDETFEPGPSVQCVGKRIAAGKIPYISCAKASRRMVDTNIADNTKLAGPVVKMSSRYVIAETIARPGKLLRPGRDGELC